MEQKIHDPSKYPHISIDLYCHRSCDLCEMGVTNDYPMEGAAYKINCETVF